VGLVPLCPRQGIWYNARGSASGSMVAYTLDITLVEPVHHGLIFERFLEPWARFHARY
jgi:DNA polymerase III subunit alpha